MDTDDIFENSNYSLFLKTLVELNAECTTKLQKLIFEFIKSQVSLYGQIIKDKKSDHQFLPILDNYDLKSFFGSDDIDENSNKLKELRMKIKEVNSKNKALKSQAKIQ